MGRVLLWMSLLALMCPTAAFDLSGRCSGQRFTRFARDFPAAQVGLDASSFGDEVGNTSTGASRREVLECARNVLATAGLGTYVMTYPRPAAAEANDNANKEQNMVATPSTSPQQQAEAQAPTECDEECKEKRRQRIEERRAMMRQSRSSTSRQEVFELSKQRAKLYGSEYKGAKCIDGVPCL